ncbi:MAG TPA: GTP-binding protein, partial [Rhodocyclaceae bacterium]|nr:GTP-binding protein [Rhodocyclaceae bacterium]
MCTVCGCGSGEVYVGGVRRTAGLQPKAGAARGWKAVTTADSVRPQPAQAVHAPAGHVRDAPQHLHFGHGAAHAHAPGLTQSQMVRIERDILGKNDAIAAANRRALRARGIFALNLVSSPGSGKTSLLVRTIGELAGRVPVAVIEGDQQTEFDAERIRAT